MYLTSPNLSGFRRFLHLGYFGCCLNLTGFITLLLFPFISFSQQKEFEQAPKLEIGKYIRQESPNANRVVEIEMNLGEFEILNPWAVEVLETKKIDSIHLVYTDYPKEMDFTELNQNRFGQLFELFPELSAEHYIKWKVLRQTDCHTLEEAKNFFHGFVVYYQDVIKPHLDPIYLKKRKAYFDRKFERAALFSVGVTMGEDSSAYRVMDRQAENWKNIVFVCDWTGSMYPYSLQVLKWQIDRHAHQKVLGYVFFNDGDLKTTKEKVIGETGGIYKSPNALVYTVFDFMKQAKSRGDGGDIPENDLEAVLYAMKEFPQAEEFVLIADNISPVRDMDLLDQVHKPIRIVLNRLNRENVSVQLNQDYVKIALATKGSIHTDDADYLTEEAIRQLEVQD